eukprot:10845441-Heterocapsa_arctica.AAC.1
MHSRGRRREDDNPLQAEARGGGDDHPDHRLQRGVRRAQKQDADHQLHVLGRGRTVQHAAVVAPLLQGHGRL